MSEKGYTAKPANTPGTSPIAWIYVCHECQGPTFFDPEGNQTPGDVIGETVPDVPDKSVESLYDEARRCTGAKSYTAAVLACRKLLMHVAVSKGAEQNKSFLEYVEYLGAKGYVPPDAMGWVDHIRATGNEANHEIKIMDREAAKELLGFSEMLLKMIFEFPAKVQRRTASKKV